MTMEASEAIEEVADYGGGVLEGYQSESEFCEGMGIHKKTLRRWRSLGEGPPFVKIGGRRFYSVKACRDWLAERMTTE